MATSAAQDFLQNSSTVELQAALGVLIEMPGGDGDEILRQALQLLESETTFDPTAKTKPFLAVPLDVTTAAEARGTGELKKLLTQYEKRMSELGEDNPLVPFEVALQYGDASRGEALFRGHRRAQCLRCHKVKGTGGEAGPDLSKVASRGDRRFLLESLIDPHAKIAKGFGTVTFILNDGKVVSGTVKAESKSEVVLRLSDGRERTIKAADIDDRTMPMSPMPGVRDVLTKYELRDLVEFLSTLK